jgi:hypothetical protein
LAGDVDAHRFVPRHRATVEDRVFGEIADEALEIAFVHGGEEAVGELRLARAADLEARIVGLDMLARTREDLTAVRLALLDDRRDLVVFVLEDLAEQEDRPLPMVRAVRAARSVARLPW